MTVSITPELQKISDARHHDPFSILGRHQINGATEIYAYLPHAVEVTLAEDEQPLARIGDSDFFTLRANGKNLPERYRLIWLDNEHRQHIRYDPYSFRVTDDTRSTKLQCIWFLVPADTSAIGRRGTNR